MNDQPTSLPQEAQTSPASANGNGSQPSSGGTGIPLRELRQAATSKSAKVERTDRPSLHKSTGPRTPQGKERSKFNARKHGLFSKAVLLQDESRAEYDALLNGLMEDFHSQGKLETVPVETLAVLMWRKRRLLQVEMAKISNRIAKGLADGEYARDGSERPLHITIHFAEPHTSLDQDKDMVPAPMASTETQKPKFNTAAVRIPSDEASDHLIRYEAHLSREIDRILNRLERLQRIRKGQPLPPQLDVKIS
jgi:hypothetical protein